MQVFFSEEIDRRASMFSSVIKSQLKLVVAVSLNWVAGALLKEPSDRALPGSCVSSFVAALGLFPCAPAFSRWGAGPLGPEAQ